MKQTELATPLRRFGISISRWIRVGSQSMSRHASHSVRGFSTRSAIILFRSLPGAIGEYRQRGGPSREMVRSTRTTFLYPQEKPGTVEGEGSGRRAPMIRFVHFE